LLQKSGASSLHNFGDAIISADYQSVPAQAPAGNGGGAAAMLNELPVI